MSDAPAALDLQEQVIRMDERIAHIDEMLAHRDRIYQEMRYQPLMMALTGLGAGAALFAAAFTFLKAFH